jgi:hypothetical protein
MDRIQSLEAAESAASLGETDGSWLPDSLANMKNKAKEKLKKMKERWLPSDKKKKKESEEDAEEGEQEPATVQPQMANLYLVHERD